MTKRLEEIFELPDGIKQDEPETVNSSDELISQDTFSTIEKIESALPTVRGLDATDQEMDELASMAVNSYKDLQDLGMQVDSRFSAEIFSVAGTMLGHAITAKTAKINKKLKMIELQLKKASLEQKQQTKDEQIEATPLGEGKSLDRNELLRVLLNKNTDK